LETGISNQHFAISINATPISNTSVGLVNTQFDVFHASLAARRISSRETSFRIRSGPR